MEDLIESSYLPPPIPPLWRGGQITAVRAIKLSVLLAQLLRVLSSKSKDHGLDSPKVLFPFSNVSVCMYMVDGEGRCIMLHYRPRAVMSTSSIVLLLFLWK